MSKPREFWILADNPSFSPGIYMQEQIAKDRKLKEDQIIHLIEHSAYQKAVDEISRLQFRLRDSFHARVCLNAMGCHCTEKMLENDVLKELGEL